MTLKEKGKAGKLLPVSADEKSSPAPKLPDSENGKYRMDAVYLGYLEEERQKRKEMCRIIDKHDFKSYLWGLIKELKEKGLWCE